ncbi:MAG: hypothetical protein AAGJ18_06915 [Bacteroidota bacterium]
MAVYQPNTVDTIFTSTLTGQQTIVFADSVLAVETRNFQHFNRHTRLQIPLLVAFELGKKRWRWAWQTGLAFQLLHRSEGRVAISEGIIADFPKKRRYQVNIRYVLETQLSYQVFDDWSVFTRLGWENQFSDWKISNDPAILMVQRPSLLRSSIGVRRSF